MENGRCVTWDVTVTDMLAQSYLSSTSITSGGAAEAAAQEDVEIFAAGSDLHLRAHSNGNSWTHEQGRIPVLSELGRRISQESGDHREGAFIFQRLSITVQRFNAVAVQGTFATHTPPEDDV